MEEVQDEGSIRLPKKAVRVKNKAPAPVQITAEQLLREAKERNLEILPPPPKKRISDPEELREYQYKRRKEFEDNIRKNRSSIPNWIRYAKWEEEQGELQRSRSVFERALEVAHRNVTIWLQYAEMEIRNRQINHARNVWDRAVSLLPRAIQFWLKYTYMEEMLGNIPGARQVFERWMEWEPGEQAWSTYINFEMRYHEVDRARLIWQRFINADRDSKNWIRYARFEERQGSIKNARQVYERAVEYFGTEHVDVGVLLAFAKFEERQKEHDRVRVIYRYALEHVPKDKLEPIQKALALHEKKYGEKISIENVIVSKRKDMYEQQVQANPFNYDAWFDYLRLLESEEADHSTIRETYERAIAQVPPKQVKRLWRRYIYLWINYALYEELIAESPDRTRQVYNACIELLPHKKFTFAKIWLMFAHFEIRQGNLIDARKILGVAIGKCPKEKLFRGYIDLELQLREFDRCRILYEKALQFAPENCTCWIKYAELETLLGDIDRARGVYELAISQPALDMPEVLWKSYIDFEISQEEFANARQLYQRLLEKTQNVKVWISFAQFEANTDDDDRVDKSRRVYRNANTSLRASATKEERLALLESWKAFEEEYGSEESLREVEGEMPKRVKKRRKATTEDGVDIGWEEYYDYIFPSDEVGAANMKLLALAKQWKQKQLEQQMRDSQKSAESGEQAEIKEELDRSNLKTFDQDQEKGDTDTDLEDSSSSESED